MIKCPNPDCGYENVDGTQFCEGCGEELPHNQQAAGTATASTAATGGGAPIKCPACDNMNPSDNVVCEVCGTELKGAGAGTGHTLTPDAATAPPVVGVLGNDIGHPVGVDSHPAADTTIGPLAGAGITSADTGHTDLSGTIAVPATAPPVGGMASPPASVGQSAIDAASTHSAASPGLPAMATGVDAATSDPAADNAATVIAPAAPGAAGHLEPGHVKMTVEQGMLVGQQFVLGDNEMLVGREDEEEGIYPDIDLSDQDAGYVHRRHASLKFDNGNLTVTHLGGTNKTRVNNRPLPDNTPQAVNLGDKVSFGKVVLRVQPN